MRIAPQPPEGYDRINRFCISTEPLDLPENSPYAWAVSAEMEDGTHQEVYITDRHGEPYQVVTCAWDDAHADLLSEMRTIAMSLEEK